MQRLTLRSGLADLHRRPSDATFRELLRGPCCASNRWLWVPSHCFRPQLQCVKSQVTHLGLLPLSGCESCGTGGPLPCSTIHAPAQTACCTLAQPWQPLRACDTCAGWPLLPTVSSQCGLAAQSWTVREWQASPPRGPLSWGRLRRQLPPCMRTSRRGVTCPPPAPWGRGCGRPVGASCGAGVRGST